MTTAPINSGAAATAASTTFYYDNTAAVGIGNVQVFDSSCKGCHTCCAWPNRCAHCGKCRNCGQPIFNQIQWYWNSPTIPAAQPNYPYWIATCDSQAGQSVQ